MTALSPVARLTDARPLEPTHSEEVRYRGWECSWISDGEPTVYMDCTDANIERVRGIARAALATPETTDAAK